MTVAVGFAVLGVAACGDSDDGGPAATAAPASSLQVTTTTEGPPTVTTGQSDLGEILVDGAGFTLYRFTDDASGVSNCVSDCAEIWPPLIPEGALVVGDGLEPTSFGTVTRPDGMVQLTVDGLPLYTFSGDTAAGQVNGQGVAGTWFAVTPDGQLVGPEGAGGQTTTTGGETGGATTTITIPPIGY